MAGPSHSRFNEELRNLLLELLAFGIEEAQRAPRPSIDMEEFYARLYVSRDPEIESALSREVAKGNALLVVAGPAGGGKTTLVHRFLEEAREAGAGILLLDFKELAEMLYRLRDGSDPHSMLSLLTSVVNTELGNRFLTDQNTSIKFTLEAISTFFQARLRNLELQYSVAAGSSITPERALEILRSDFDVLQEEAAFVRSNLTSSQAIRLVRRTHDLERFLVVFDNVDRVAVSLQPLLFSFAIDLNHGGAGEFGVIVALRNKSLLRYQEAGADGDVVRVVSHGGLEEVTLPIRIPPPSEDFFHELMLLRIAAIRERLVESTVWDPASWDRFAQRAEAVLGAALRTDLLAISNHNIRNALALVAGYLLESIDHDPIRVTGEDLQPEQAELQSDAYLYSWILRKESGRNEIMPQVIRNYDQFSQEEGGDSSRCVVECLILAWLHQHQSESVRVKDLVSAFSRVGFSKELLIDVAYRLYDMQITRRFIELGNTEKRYSLQDTSSMDLRITLTPRGSHFVTRGIVSFEYLHQAIRYTYLEEEFLYADDSLVHHNLSIRVANILWFLRGMRVAETDAIARIKLACSGMITNWDAYFREQFCVARLHLFERLVRSHCVYLRAVAAAELYEDWEAAYRDALAAYHRALGIQSMAGKLLGESGDTYTRSRGNSTD